MGEVEDRGEAFLEHFGVKGMRWGVRKNPEKAAAKAEKKLVKADKKWEKQQFTLSQGIKRHNEMADMVNANVERFNNDPRWVGKNFLLDKKADQEYTDAFNKEILEPAFRIAVERVHGTSPSGRLKMDVKKKPDGTLQMYVRKNDAKHADDSIMGTYLFSVTYDSAGRIKSLAPKTDSLQQAEVFVGDFLSHYGVKGMKWGVRKSEDSGGSSSSTSSKAKKFMTFVDDVAFEFSADSDSTRNTIAYEAGKINKPRQKAINEKYAASGKNKIGARLKSPRDPDTKAYRKESRESFVRSLEEAANSHTNKSGTRQYTITDGYGGPNRSKYFWTVRTRPIKHADDGEIMLFEPIFDANGLITDVKYRGVSGGSSMAQADDFVSDFLAHYGVKGMKWGVRKSDVPTGETRVTQKGKKLKGEGGKGLPAHDDAKKAAVSKQKAKGSGLQSLSNKELQDLQKRMNLEQNVRELSAKEKQATANPAARFIRKTLMNSGKQEAQKASNNATSKLVANMMKAK